MTAPDRTDGAPWRNFYGRRRGKTLRPSQKTYLDEDLATLSPGLVSWDENPDRRPLDLAEVLPGCKETWLEIGFGGGEHLVHQAAQNPEIGIIGCEPYINGVAMLLGKIRAAGVENLRVHPGDARDLLDVLPTESLTRVFLLYPDPWPKKRHHRRRFVNPEFIAPLAERMAKGARLRLATDIGDYARQALQVLTPEHGFRWLAERPGDWRTPWPDWTRTRYEAKAIRENRTPIYLTFERI